MTQQGTPLARLLGRFFPALEGAGIRSCVLRGYEGLPEATRNDVDLAVEPGSGQRAEHWLRRAAEETGWLVVGAARHPGFRRVLLFHRDHPGGVLPIDLVTRHEVWSMPYASAETVLETRVPRGDLHVARAGCEAAISLLKGLVRHGVVKKREDHRERLRECARDDSEGFLACAGEALGEPLAADLVLLCAEGRWSDLEARAAAVRWRLARRTGVLRVVGSAVRSFLRTRFEALRRRGGLEVRGGMFVVLLGPDGSGKTTLSRGLEERVGSLFAGVEHFHSLAGVLPRLGGIKRAFYGAQGKPVPDSPLKGVKQPGVVGKPLPALRSASYISYYGIEYFLYRFALRGKLRRNHLIIFDRYFYDYYLMRAHLNAPRWLLRFFSKLVAQPDVLFVMLADPELIFRRKDELTPEEIQRQQDILKGLELPTAARIDTSESAEQTAREAAAIVARKLDPGLSPSSS